MDFPRELRYTKDHEWARIEGEFAVVGITDYAQNKLGSIVFVDLPSVGQSFSKGATLITVDSVKAVAEVYAPVSGRVEEVNRPLGEQPEVINRDPYGEGWMVRLKMADAAELQGLLSSGDYEALVEAEEAKG